MGAHLIDGDFQSDKYPTTPRGKVPLSVRDATAQDLLYAYAQRRRLVDAEFSDDLETALEQAGYRPGPSVAGTVVIEVARASWAAAEIHVIPRGEVRLVTVEHANSTDSQWFLTYELVNGPHRAISFNAVQDQEASAAHTLMKILTRGRHDMRIVQRDDGSWHVVGVDGDEGGGSP
jgi:hypothetical protein